MGNGGRRVCVFRLWIGCDAFHGDEDARPGDTALHTVLPPDRGRRSPSPAAAAAARRGRAHRHRPLATGAVKWPAVATRSAAAEREPARLRPRRLVVSARAVIDSAAALPVARALRTLIARRACPWTFNNVYIYIYGIPIIRYRRGTCDDDYRGNLSNRGSSVGNEAVNFYANRRTRVCGAPPGRKSESFVFYRTPSPCLLFGRVFRAINAKTTDRSLDLRIIKKIANDVLSCKCFFSQNNSLFGKFIFIIQRSGFDITFRQTDYSNRDRTDFFLRR